MNNMRVKEFMLFFLVLLYFSFIPLSFSNNTKFISADELTNNIRESLLQQFNPQGYDSIDIVINDIDPRLKLQRCDNNLSLTQNGNQIASLLPGRSTLLVRCNGKKTWHFYLPITINAWQTIPTLKMAITKNHVIQLQDIEWQSRNIARLRGAYLSQSQNIIGKISRRNLAKGATLYAKFFIEPNVITKGDKVQLVSKVGSIIVTSNGIAKESGAIGSHIDVENIRSKRVITGQITSKSTVTLNL